MNLNLQSLSRDLERSLHFIHGHSKNTTDTKRCNYFRRLERYATAYPVQFFTRWIFCRVEETEILRERLDALGQLETYVGTYFSKRWVQKNALNFTDEEIQLMDLEISNELRGSTPRGWRRNMSAKEFVDALQNGKNLDAEDAFKMQQCHQKLVMR